MSLYKNLQGTMVVCVYFKNHDFFFSFVSLSEEQQNDT